MGEKVVSPRRLNSRCRPHKARARTRTNRPGAHSSLVVKTPKTSSKARACHSRPARARIFCRKAADSLSATRPIISSWWMRWSNRPASWHRNRSRSNPNSSRSPKPISRNSASTGCSAPLTSAMISFSDRAEHRGRGQPSIQAISLLIIPRATYQGATIRLATHQRPSLVPASRSVEAARSLLAIAAVTWPSVQMRSTRCCSRPAA